MTNLERKAYQQNSVKVVKPIIYNNPIKTILFQYEISYTFTHKQAIWY